MSDVATPARQKPGTALRGFSAAALLLLGVVVIPWTLALLFNSWDAPDAAAYVRMAFAAVAGSTIAIATVVGLLVDRIIRRAPLSTISAFAVIALVVVLLQVGAISGAARNLLSGLGFA